jgi:hypothetical protein
MKTEQNPDVPNALIWCAATADSPVVFLECARWFDARTVARLLFGSEPSLHSVELEKIPKMPLPRVQVRWEGMPGRDRRMQTRTVRESGDQEPWLNVG